VVAVQVSDVDETLGLNAERLKKHFKKKQSECSAICVFYGRLTSTKVCKKEQPSTKLKECCNIGVHLITKPFSLLGK